MKATAWLGGMFFSFACGAYLATRGAEPTKPCRAVIYESRMPVLAISQAECKSICTARERDRKLIERKGP